MALNISTNLASINAQRNLSLNQSGLATSMQRLSSGMRVNSAKDDAAGLAISERMHSQIRGMNQAARNTNDAISLLQTAEGATSKISDMLQRMRELSVQSINATNSDSDREALQAEAAQLKKEIDRIGATSKFNGMQVFHQSRSPVAGGDPFATELLAKLKGGWLARAEKLVKDLYGIDTSNVTMNVKLTGFTDGAYGVGAYVSAPTSGSATNLTLQLDLADFKVMDESASVALLAHEMTHAVMAAGKSWGGLQNDVWFIEGAAEFIYGADERIAQEGGWSNVAADALQSWGGTTLDYASGYAAVRYLHNELAADGGIKAVLGQLQTQSGLTLETAIRAVNGDSTWSLATFISTYEATARATTSPSWLNLGNADSGSIAGSDAGSGGDLNKAAVVALANGAGTDMTGFNPNWENLPSGGTGPGNLLGFQVGANAGDFVYTNIGSMNLGSLGIEDLDLSTSSGATSALSRLDAAIDYVSSLRGHMGAQMSRFDSIIAVLQIGSENISASRGRITDADYAQETAQFSRTQILQQASTAMVAQANQMHQSVLMLLR